MGFLDVLKSAGNYAMKEADKVKVDKEKWQNEYERYDNDQLLRDANRLSELSFGRKIALKEILQARGLAS